jgi:soluble cytochrome b562
LKEIKKIYEEMELLISQIDGEDAAKEVDEEYVIFDKNTKLLLEATQLEDYLTKHALMCESKNGVLECFDLLTTDELKQYIDKNEISFDELKIETAKASLEALENLIYEAEEDEY